MSVPSRRTRGQKLIGWCVGKDSNVELGMDEGLKVVALWAADRVSRGRGSSLFPFPFASAAQRFWRKTLGV